MGCVKTIRFMDFSTTISRGQMCGGRPLSPFSGTGGLRPPILRRKLRPHKPFYKDIVPISAEVSERLTPERRGGRHLCHWFANKRGLGRRGSRCCTPEMIAAVVRRSKDMGHFQNEPSLTRRKIADDWKAAFKGGRPPSGDTQDAARSAHVSEVGISSGRAV